MEHHSAIFLQVIIATFRFSNYNNFDRPAHKYSSHNGDYGTVGTYVKRR